MPNKLKWKIFKNRKPALGVRVLLRKGYVAKLRQRDVLIWEIDAVSHAEIFPSQDSDKWVSFSELVKFLDKQ